jgi:hypothetical protein
VHTSYPIPTIVKTFIAKKLAALITPRHRLPQRMIAAIYADSQHTFFAQTNVFVFCANATVRAIFAHGLIAPFTLCHTRPIWMNRAIHF